MTELQYFILEENGHQTFSTEHPPNENPACGMCAHINLANRND